MTDAEELMDFLASPEAMELPDQIEEVNAKQLDKLVQEKMFVAVFFCKFLSQRTGQTQKTAHHTISRNTKSISFFFVKTNHSLQVNNSRK